MYYYLTKISGVRLGSQFQLNPNARSTLGRGIDCTIVLSDPLCSREHATIYRENGAWWLRDEGSRNGTFVNGQRADHVQLAAGSVIQLGSNEFRFEIAEDELGVPVDLTQTIVRDASMLESDSQVVGVAAIGRDPATMADFLDLYQLSVTLLACSDPDEVISLSLEVVRRRTKASFAGFLWVADDGTLRPKAVTPQDAQGEVELSESLTKRVVRDMHAVWVKNESSDADDPKLRQFSDAVCVPLIRESRVLGALHLYLDQGRFSQSEFEFAIRLSAIVAAALQRARQQASLSIEHERLVNSAAAFDELIGESKPMQELKARIERIARATGCVLVRGESGSGKELVARAIHKHSTRADRPMRSVNCAAMPRDLMESQLFGHRKGAFTGADADHTGWFQQADAGTLFLDEVGEMTLEGQAKLLRILEGHSFLPVGGTEEVSVDVRIIAATNRNLAEVVRDRNFREDLYYRLSVFELYIPPLRERGGDIGLLLEHFLDHFKVQHGRPNLHLSEQAREKLLAYHWPGNVRQLRNAIDSAVVMAPGDALQPEDFGLYDAGGEQTLDSLRIDLWEQKLIREALSRTKNNIPEAAKLLGIGRATLYRKVDEYGIER